MARSITEIQNEIIATVQADVVLGPLLTSTSKTAVWRLWTYIVAVAIWAQENLFDLLRIETDEKISLLKPHSLRWYAEKAKAFQYGFNLVPETDYYDNTGIDDETIQASKVVDYAAVIEQTRGLRIKVAKDDGTDLQPLSNPELTAFVEYMHQVKDAGVKLNITTNVADNLKLVMEVYYNPLVLDNAGSRLDGSNTEPVQSAIKTYLKNLPFNGVFILQNLVDVIQVVEGVKIVNITGAQSRYGVLPFTSFGVKVVPDSGYLRFASDADLSITFTPYSE